MLALLFTGLTLCAASPAFAAKHKAAAAPAAAPASAPAAAPSANSVPFDQRIGIAAVVNDEAITYSDIRNRMALYLLGAPGAPPPEVKAQIAQQVLNRLIDERLQMQEAKSLGITVEDSELNNAFATVASNNKLNPDDFKKKLAGAGVKVSTLEDQIRSQIAWSMVVRRKLRPQVNISESEIDSEIDRQKSTKDKAEYLLAEIMLPVTSPDMDAVVHQNAEKMILDLQHGTRFSALAKQYSQAPGAAQGGDLGWVQQGQLDPKLDDAIAALQVGQLSAPIRTDKGYHILFVRDKRVSGVSTPIAPAAATAAPVPATPASPAATAAPAAASATPAEDTLHVMQLVIPVTANDAKPVVDAKLSRARSLQSELTSCAALSTKAKDFLASGGEDLGTKPLSGFAPDVQAVVKDLAVNTLSAPQQSSHGIAVLMVCDRDKAEPAKTAAASDDAVAPPPPAEKPAAAAPAAPANAGPGPAPGPSASGAPTGDTAREEVANKLGMQRLEQLQDRYLKDLRATAYIEKRM